MGAVAELRERGWPGHLNPEELLEKLPEDLASEVSERMGNVLDKLESIKSRLKSK